MADIIVNGRTLKFKSINHAVLQLTEEYGVCAFDIDKKIVTTEVDPMFEDNSEKLGFVVVSTKDLGLLK